MALYKFTSSTTLNLTSSKSVLIECFGAGGRGSKTGNGGSGGAYDYGAETEAAGGDGVLYLTY